LLDQAAADDAEGAIRWVPLSPATLTKVAAVYAALPASTFLRAADALHLATAVNHDLLQRPPPAGGRDALRTFRT
jgi:hypothetical protein